MSVSAALALGILAGFEWNATPAAMLVAASAAALLALLLLLFAQPRWAFLAVLAGALVAGAGYASARTAARQGRHLAALLSAEPAILSVRGFIADRPLEQAQPPRRKEPPRVLTRFTLQVAAVRAQPSATPAAGAEWSASRAAPLNGAPEAAEPSKEIPIAGRLRVLLEGPADGLAYGDEVEGVLSARLPPPAGNPGEFDYARHLARKGVAGVATAPAEALHRTGGVRALPGLRSVYALKNRMLRFLDAHMTDRSARILKCLVLGEPNTLAEDQLRVFRETGSLHLLAISGQHISLIAVCCWGALTLLGLRHRLAAAAVLTVVLFYGVLAGMEPSILRAVVMCNVFCAAFLFVRRPDAASAIALALLFVLLLDPADLYNAGMQLSFVAVLGIWLLTGPIERALFPARDPLDRLQAPGEQGWRNHPLRWALQKAVAVSLAAWLATLPLMAWHFHMITPAAPLAGLALYPPVTLALIAGLPAVLLAPVIGAGAQPLLWVAEAGTRVTDWACVQLAAVPHLALYVPVPSGWLVALCYAVLGALAFRERLGLGRWRAAALALLPPLAYLALVWHQSPPDHLRVRMLAVGRGNCVLVQFPGGKSLLFDAGSAGTPQIGSRVLAPALSAVGVRRLDLVLLSHGDGDHVNGFAELARRIPVGRLAVPESFEAHADAATLDAIRASGVPVLRIGMGDRIGGFGDAEVRVLWPPRDLPRAKFATNELSAVLRVASPDGAVLLTGDFGRRATGLLLGAGADLRADLLQVPHHGMADPSAETLARAAQPRIALVPGGREACLQPYEQHAGRVLTTDGNGMITVDLVDGVELVSTYRKNAFLTAVDVIAHGR